MRAAIVLMLLGAVRADLPIHCLHKQIIGKWKVSVGEINSDNTITCGHQIPDRVMTMPNAKISPSNPGFTITKSQIVDLQDPNIAVSKDGTKGTWTMVYDEGFEIVIGGNKYFTFFRYEPKGPDPSEESVDDFTSFCYETVSGWYHDENKKWGCFVASKITNNGKKDKQDQEPIPPSSMSEPTPLMVSPTALGKPCDEGKDAGNDASLGCDKSNQGDNQQYYPKFKNRLRRVHQISLAHTNIKPIPRRSALLRPRFMQTGASVSSGMTTVSRQSMLDDNALFVSDINFIEMINKDVHSTWSARAYKQFEGKTMHHMAALLGRSRFMHPAPEQNNAKKPEQGPVPKSLDWRHIEGGKYMTPVINQGGCGSCYAVSTADVASMRLRIKTEGRDKTILSPQHVVSCSITNQGCAGGYPFLVGKHGEEMGFVPESCQPYSGDDKECNMECYKQKLIHVKNYRYIGGYYGGCSEHAMIMELQKGPIVTALNAPGDLFYYHQGVYSARQNKKDTDFHGKSRWEKTNHAVVITGYGQEPNGQKYWWIKNSWAKSWGIDGFFKMIRGEDAVAVESMAVAFDIQEETR